MNITVTLDDFYVRGPATSKPILARHGSILIGAKVDKFKGEGGNKEAKLLNC